MPPTSRVVLPTRDAGQVQLRGRIVAAIAFAVWNACRCPCVRRAPSGAGGGKMLCHLPCSVLSTVPGTIDQRWIFLGASFARKE